MKKRNLWLIACLFIQLSSVCQTIQFNDCHSLTDSLAKAECNQLAQENFLKEAVGFIEKDLSYYIEDSLSISFDVNQNLEIQVTEGFSLFSNAAFKAFKKHIFTLKHKITKENANKKFRLSAKLNLPEKFKSFKNIEYVSSLPEVIGYSDFNEKAQKAGITYPVALAKSQIKSLEYMGEFEAELHFEEGTLVAVQMINPAMNKKIIDEATEKLQLIWPRFIDLTDKEEIDPFTLVLSYSHTGEDSINSRRFRLKKLEYLEEVNTLYFLENLLDFAKIYFPENNAERKEFLLNQLKEAQLDQYSIFKSDDFSLNIDSIKNAIPKLESDLADNETDASIDGRVPVFKGCDEDDNNEELKRCFEMRMLKHVGKKFKFPEMARRKGIQGKMHIDFVIEKDGSISTIRMSKCADPLLDFEGIRTVSEMPDCKYPAILKGEPVRMSFTLPINAMLQ